MLQIATAPPAPSTQSDICSDSDPSSEGEDPGPDPPDSPPPVEERRVTLIPRRTLSLSPNCGECILIYIQILYNPYGWHNVPLAHVYNCLPPIFPPQFRDLRVCVGYFYIFL